MKRFMITWEYLQTGVSYVDAENLDDAKEKAEESNIDFSDTVEQWDDGWKVKTVEEVKT